VNSSNRHTRTLERAEIIAPAGPGKGLPLLLPWGLAVLRTIVDRFAQAFARLYPLRFRAPSLLREAEGYDREVAPFGGFEGVYRIDGASGAHVVRPDAAVDNLSVARDAVREGWDGAVLALYEGFRRVSGATPALFRDRRIWPFVQLSRLAPISRCREEAEAILGALASFFSDMRLPVEWVAHGPWKSYARQRYEAVIVLPDGTPTVAAMFYVVGDAYRAAAGIDERWQAFDIGISEKIAALFALLSPPERGLALPSLASPVRVVIATPGAESQAAAAAQGFDALLVDADDSEWPQRWRNRGVPVLVERRGTRQRVCTPLSGWRRWPEGTSLAAVLEEYDRQLAELFARPARRFASTWFRAYCKSCLPRQGIRASAIPETTHACSSCGAPGARYLIHPGSQFY
jgi:hypothetical protein